MKRHITVHEPRAILTGPQRPLSMPAIGLRALQPRPLTFHEADKGLLGGAAITKAMEAHTDPADKAVAGLKSLAEQWDFLVKDHTRLDKATKDLLEDLTKQKNGYDGLGSSMKGIEQTMLKLNQRIKMEAGAAFGDPLKRIQNDPEQRTLLNALYRANFLAKGLKLSEAHEKALEESGCEKQGSVWVQKATLTEGSTPGSTWLRSELDRNIYSVLQTYGIWNTLDVVPTGTLTHVLPVLTADPVCNFIDEGAAITPDSAIAGTSVSATAKKMATIVTISRELLQDSEYDVTSLVLQQIGRATAKRADYAAFRADGTNDATNGAATGVFNFGTSVVAPSGATTVEGMIYQDLNAVLLGTDVEVFNRGPRWWMHRFILFRLLNIVDGNGRPIFLTALEAPNAGGIMNVLGYPVTTGNILPTTNSTGATIAAFGDGGAYHVGVRQQVEMLTSDIPYFTTDLVAIRAIARMSFKGKKATALGLATLA